MNLLLAAMWTVWSPGPHWLVILPGALIVVALLVTARQHRQHARETATRLCRGCGASHPPYAQFCRHCGRRIETKG